MIVSWYHHSFTVWVYVKPLKMNSEQQITVCHAWTYIGMQILAMPAQHMQIKPSQVRSRMITVQSLNIQ